MRRPRRAQRARHMQPAVLARLVLLALVASLPSLPSLPSLRALAPRTQPTSGPGTLERAYACYHAGDYARAATLFEQALPEHSTTRGALHYAIGNCAYRLGRFAEAALAYRRALAELPRDPEVLANLRRAEDQLGLPQVEPTLAATLFAATPPATLLAIAAVLQTLGLTGFVLARRRRTRAMFVLTALLGLAGIGAIAADALRHARREGVVLANEAALRPEPHEHRTGSFALRAGEVVRIEAMSDRWAHVAHPRGTGWIERDAIGVVE